VPHVFKHHGQGLSIRAHAVETHNMLVLKHRQQLRLPLEVLSGRLVGVLQRLWGGGVRLNAFAQPIVKIGWDFIMECDCNCQMMNTFESLKAMFKK